MITVNSQQDGFMKRNTVGDGSNGREKLEEQILEKPDKK